jgi:GTPase SAR1 family protein
LAHIWDTASQEIYNTVASVYSRDAHVTIIVYEITSVESFNKIEKGVSELCDHSNNKDIIIVIAGNKSDMETLR